MNNETMNKMPSAVSHQPLAIRYWLFAILLFGFAFRVHALGAQSFWLDEAYTWGVVTRTTWGDVWGAMLAVSDVSPLYYVLAKLVTPLWGASEFGFKTRERVLRLVSHRGDVSRWAGDV